MASKSTKYFRSNPKSLAKKRAWQRKENKKKKKKRYRAFLNRMRRKFGRYGNRDGMDYDHDEKKFITAKRNRSKK
tara:strand:- start:952 stop:1176 length:225 start_codon:yes stop_codon:yes gene_type:complete